LKVLNFPFIFGKTVEGDVAFGMPARLCYWMTVAFCASNTLGYSGRRNDLESKAKLPSGTLFEVLALVRKT